MEKKNRAGRYHHRFVVPFFVVLTVAFLCFAAVGTVAAQDDISNAQELQDIRDDLDGDYVVTEDIDLSGVNNFEPIGVEEDPFTGTFDGNGHTITGLTIERLDDEGVGLFGDTGTGATVRNVSLEDVSVDGEQWVGALVGYNQGEIINSHATGSAVADTRVGGLVGGNEGSITNSYAEGDVTSVDIAGGLAGLNIGDIEESYADTSVAGFEGVTARDMGGLVGINDGEVEDSYARGEVLGDRFLGGLVGASDGDVVESYAAVEVVGDEDTGGLVGDLNFGGSGAVLRDSYWDEDTTAQTGAVGTQSGSPTVENVERLATNEMQGDAAETNMDEFDFTTTWRTVTNPNDYPVLAWQVEDSDSSSANFDVTIDSTNSPVTEGETLTADVTVENTGGEQATQTVSLTVGGTVRDSVDVTLDAGGSTTETLEWATGEGDEGDYTVTVGSEDDTETRSVSVVSGANFEVTIDDTNSPVTEGETLTADVTVENIGDGSGTQQVSLGVGGSERDSTEVSIAGGDSTTETLEWETTSGDAGSYTLTVESEDDSDTTSVTVEGTGTNPVSIDSPGTVLPDGEFDFTVEMRESSVGEVAVESSDFDVELSVVDDAGDSIGAQTDTSVEFIDIDEETSTYTLRVNVTGGTEGDTGTITAATGGNIGDSDVDQVSSTFTLADASESPVEDVSDDLWTVVTQDDNEAGLSLADLGNAIQQYQANPSDAEVDGVSIALSDLGSLIQYYQNQVA
jgi:hypothetical protein